MQKRTNPLESKPTEQPMLKRTNPLELDSNPEKGNHISFDSIPTLKKKFIFTRASKDLLSLLKDAYPNQKLGDALNYLMINHLSLVNKDAVDKILKENKEDDK